MIVKQRTGILTVLMLGLALLSLQGSVPTCAQGLPPFADFQTSMEQTLKVHGLDPQHQALHYVVLLNTVSTQGPVPQGMRNILEGLMRHYLAAPTSGPGDMASFSAFEMHLRPEGQVWNQSFSTGVADTLLKSVPDRPQNRIENGGHDVEASVLEAINHLNSRTSAVIIVLSDTEISHTPLTQPNYALEDNKADFTKRLASAGFAEAAREPLHGNFTGNSPDGEGTLWYRIYLPTTPKALASMPEGRVVAPLIPSRPPVTTTKPDRNLVITDPGQTASAQSSEIGVWPYIAFGFVAICLGIYLHWIFQPRTVQVGSSTGTVRFQQDVFVGNTPSAGANLGRNAIQVPEMPVGQKLGVLRLTPLGEVILRGVGRYKIDQGQVVLTATPKRVVVREGNSKVMDLNVQNLK